MTLDILIIWSTICETVLAVFCMFLMITVVQVWKTMKKYMEEE